MDAQTIQKFKSLFENEKKKIVLANPVVDDSLRLNQDDLLDELDLCSSELQQAVQLRLKKREASFLKKIDHALSRIHMGTFGTCESCEEEIDFKRLEARPTTTLCIHCKEEQEKSERSFSGSLSREQKAVKLVGIA